MEVHHHPEVDKKGLKEYLLEGVMIFIAVTMGFFAESLREHVNERHTEKEYMIAMARDLAIDTSRINTVIKQNISILHRLDTLQDILLAVPSDQSSIVRCYKLKGAAEDEEDVNFSDVTFNQLKSSGDMRLIHIPAISGSIIDYENGITNCLDQATFYSGQTEKLAEEGKNIFRPDYVITARKYFLIITDTSVAYRHGGRSFYDSLSAVKPFTFMTRDPDVFSRYCNELLNYSGIISSYLMMIQEQKRRAVALMGLLQRNYKLSSS
jgi:hypothetical protein